MLRTRVIPVLLLMDGGLVKGKEFKKHRYVGDPINAVKIFNEKQVDELIFLDISATNEKRDPDFDLISDIASETFMPFGYGGGIKNISTIERLFSLGVEKVVINTEAFYNPKLITQAASVAGSQSVVVSIDVRKSIFGNYEVYVENGSVRTRLDPVSYAKKMEELGAGEIVLCSIDREGTGKGYDLNLIKQVTDSVNIPVVCLGGAGNINDLARARQSCNVSGLAAGNFFVFHGKHKAVLITYPDYFDLEQVLN